MFRTMGICLAAGVGLGMLPGTSWAQAASSMPGQNAASGQTAPGQAMPGQAVSGQAVPGPMTPVSVAPVAPVAPVVAPGLPQGRQAIDERGYAITRSTQETVKARYLVQVMEGVLERAVKYAATQMNRRLQAVSPDLLQLSGAARARGFRLDGYGVFFDVEVPAALRQTMSWTFRSTLPNDHALDQALTALRKANSALEGKQRSEADTALKLIELKVRPNDLPGSFAYDRRTTGSAASVAATSAAAGDAAVPASNGSGSAGASGSGAEAQHAPDGALTENPDITYEMEVRDALVGAMLAYGTTLTLQPEEWLTIAARDNQNVIVPGDLSETVTIILRIKGSDLAEYRAGRLDETAARRRVEVREF